ncbi:MAG: hypothetical protein R3B72_16545 [Polyangiaceae bacterium]
MQRLQRVLASSVLRALRAREHVQIAPASTDAITDEMEALIASQLEQSPHLMRMSEAKNTIERLDPARHLEGGARDDASKAVVRMVDRITERLLESDHVDDIFADDRVLRRDAFRAIRNTLLGYIRGELEVDEVPTDTTFTVPLDHLGYVVAIVIRRIDDELLQEALERAAGSVGGTLVGLDTQRGIASFEHHGGAAQGRLALEESITEEIARFIDDELVDLPCVEQVLEIAGGTVRAEGFTEALARAEAALRAETASAASCRVIDDHRILATFVPLTEDAALRADAHFGRFLDILESEIVALANTLAGEPESGPTSRTTEHPPSQEQERGASQRPRDARARRRKRAAPRPGGEEAAEPPRSSPRGRAAPGGRKAPRGRASQTRSRATTTKPKRRKAKGG